MGLYDVCLNEIGELLYFTVACLYVAINGQNRSIEAPARLTLGFAILKFTIIRIIIL